MPIEFACPCGKQFRVDDQLAGRDGKCSRCGQKLTIPSPAVAAPPTPGAILPSAFPVLPPRRESGSLPRAVPVPPSYPTAHGAPFAIPAGPAPSSSQGGRRLMKFAAALPAVAILVVGAWTQRDWLLSAKPRGSSNVADARDATSAASRDGTAGGTAAVATNRAESWLAPVVAHYRPKQLGLLERMEFAGPEQSATAMIWLAHFAETFGATNFRGTDVLTFSHQYEAVWKNGNQFDAERAKELLRRLGLLKGIELEPYREALVRFNADPIEKLHAAGLLCAADSLFPDGRFDADRTAAVLQRLHSVPRDRAKLMSDTLHCLTVEAALCVAEIDPLFRDQEFQAESWDRVMATLKGRIETLPKPPPMVKPAPRPSATAAPLPPPVKPAPTSTAKPAVDVTTRYRTSAAEGEKFGQLISTLHLGQAMEMHGLYFTDKCTVHCRRDGTILVERAGMRVRDKQQRMWESRAAAIEGETVYALFPAP